MKHAHILVALALLGACSGKSNAPDESAAPAPAPASTSAAPEPTPEQVPVPADFAEEASASINEASYKAELAVLARDIESDKE
jgi:hypothetical protein